MSNSNSNSNSQCKPKSQNGSTHKMLAGASHPNTTASNLARMKLRATLQGHVNATSTIIAAKSNATSIHMPTKTLSLALKEDTSSKKQEQPKLKSCLKKSSSCNSTPSEAPEQGRKPPRVSSTPSLQPEKTRRKARRRRTSRSKLMAEKANDDDNAASKPVLVKGVLKKESSYKDLRFVSEPYLRNPRKVKKNVSFTDLQRSRWDSEDKRLNHLKLRRTLTSPSAAATVTARSPNEHKTGNANFSWGSNTAPKASPLSSSSMSLLAKHVQPPKKPSRAGTSMNLFQATVQNFQQGTLVQNGLVGQQQQVHVTPVANTHNKDAPCSWETLPGKPQRQTSVEFHPQEEDGDSGEDVDQAWSQEQVLTEHGDMLMEVISWNTIPSKPQRQTSMDELYHQDLDDDTDDDEATSNTTVEKKRLVREAPSKPRRRGTMDCMDSSH